MYKEFVNNRALKINEKNYIEWRYVATQSRGCKGNKIQELSTRGPSWLDQSKVWPDNIEINGSEKYEPEKESSKKNLKSCNRNNGTNSTSSGK